MPSGNPGSEITSAFRRYQFDIETELMIEAKTRAAVLGKTLRVYLRDLVRADIEGSKVHGKAKTK